MKILEWVHRKFRQNNVQGASKPEGAGDGRRSHADEDFPVLPRAVKGRNINCMEGWRSRSHRRTVKDSTPTPDADETSSVRTTPEAVLFQAHGLLAIGTLGRLDQVVEDPEVEALEVINLVEKVDSEVSPGDVELFHDELEKMLGLKTDQEPKSDCQLCGKDYQCAPDQYKSLKNGSDHRNYSYSHGINSNHVFYPLHDFFHSPQLDSKRAHKKESRTSLADLFSSTKPQSDQSIDIKAEHSKHANEKQNGGDEKRKGGDSKSGHSFVKKMLKRKTNSKPSAVGRGDQASGAECCKFDKLMGLFNKKIHPDIANASGRLTDAPKLPKSRGVNREECLNINVKNSISSKENGNENLRNQAQVMKPATCDCHHLASAIYPVKCRGLNQEHWIKTDAEYVVLEL